MKIKLLSAGRVLNVRVTRPGSALEGTELRGRTVKARVLSRGLQEGIRGLKEGQEGTFGGSSLTSCFCPLVECRGLVFLSKRRKNW